MVLLTRYVSDQPVYCNEQYEIGVDEVGRGPMFGRVYACAVILPHSSDDTFQFALMKDSKKFTNAKKLNDAAQHIMNHAIAWSIGYENESTIDRINILHSTHSAMQKAIKNVMHTVVEQKLSCCDCEENTPYLLIDGTTFTPMINPYTPHTTLIDYTTVVNGDNTYCSIAAASILAKWHRDQYIESLCSEHPLLNERYGIMQNKGYGTKQHMNGISQHGISQWHRRTFGICKTFSEINTII